MKSRRSRITRSDKGSGSGSDQNSNQNLISKILVENERGYFDLVEGSSNLVLGLTPGGLIYYINPHWLGLLQYDPREVKDRPFLELVHPSFHDYCTNAIDSAVESGEMQFVKFDVITSNDMRLPVQGNFSCYCEDDAVIAIRGFFEALSEKPVNDTLSGVALERIFLEFHDKDCSLAEPCFDDED